MKFRYYCWIKQFWKFKKIYFKLNFLWKFIRNYFTPFYMIIIIKTIHAWHFNHNLAQDSSRNSQTILKCKNYIPLKTFLIYYSLWISDFANIKIKFNCCKTVNKQNFILLPFSNIFFCGLFEFQYSELTFKKTRNNPK